MHSSNFRWIFSSFALFFFVACASQESSLTPQATDASYYEAYPEETYSTASVFPVAAAPRTRVAAAPMQTLPADRSSYNTAFADIYAEPVMEARVEPDIFQAESDPALSSGEAKTLFSRTASIGLTLLGILLLIGSYFAVRERRKGTKGVVGPLHRPNVNDERKAG